MIHSQKAHFPFITLVIIWYKNTLIFLFVCLSPLQENKFYEDRFYAPGECPIVQVSLFLTTPSVFRGTRLEPIHQQEEPFLVKPQKELLGSKLLSLP